MPRHAFSYSETFLSSMRDALQKAFDALEERRFPQEPKFTSALLGRLQGVEVTSPFGEFVRIDTTDVGDRGRDSAEKRTGADFVITATCSDGNFVVRKAILFQIKEGPIKGLAPAKRKELEEQVKKMRTVVNAPKVGGIIREGGKAMIEVASGNRFLDGEDFSTYDFPSYFNQRVITTLDGNTDPYTVDRLQDGDLPTINVTSKTNR
jgi:hypothetical protein